MGSISTLIYASELILCSTIYENKFDFHENEFVGETHFICMVSHVKSCFDAEAKGNITNGLLCFVP